MNNFSTRATTLLFAHPRRIVIVVGIYRARPYAELPEKKSAPDYPNYFRAFANGNFDPVPQKTMSRRPSFPNTKENVRESFLSTSGHDGAVKKNDDPVSPHR